MRPQPTVEHLLRELAPQVLGTLLRRHRRFDACEDAVQEALLAGAVRWPGEGVPTNPRAWLLAVASRRLIDELRSEQARRRREDTTAAPVPPDHRSAPPPDQEHRRAARRTTSRGRFGYGFRRWDAGAQPASRAGRAPASPRTA